jgi:hypothetical protein
MQSEVQFSGISALHALLVLSSSKLFQRYAIIKHISQIIFHIEELYSVIMDGKHWKNRGMYPKSKILPNLIYLGIHEYRSIFRGT